jgi:hypothetical protein
MGCFGPVYGAAGAIQFSQVMLSSRRYVTRPSCQRSACSFMLSGRILTRCENGKVVKSEIGFFFVSRFGSGIIDCASHGSQ